MAIITFTSDFGLKDHYVASVKAKIFSYSQNLKIVDITHLVERHNIIDGAYVLGSVFRDFPKGTVHLISVFTQTGKNDRLLAMKQEDHFFVGSDNGLFSLLSDKISLIVELKKDYQNNNFHPTFPEKTTLAAAAAALANEVSIYNLGPQVTDAKILINRQARTTKDQIMGCVVYIDHYGNAITNISKELFTQISQGRYFLLKYSSDTLGIISENFNDKPTENGDSLAIFNSLGFLEICMKKGSAEQLLGLAYDTPVTISFL